MASKNAKLADVLGQLQMWLIIGLAYGAFAWWVYQSKPSLQEIETKVKNAATKEQVQSLADEVRALQNAIRQEMEHPELWPQLNHQMKLLSPSQ